MNMRMAWVVGGVVTACGEVPAPVATPAPATAPAPAATPTPTAPAPELAEAEGPDPKTFAGKWFYGTKMVADCRGDGVVDGVVGGIAFRGGDIATETPPSEPTIETLHIAASTLSGRTWTLEVRDDRGYHGQRELTWTPEGMKFGMPGALVSYERLDVDPLSVERGNCPADGAAPRAKAGKRRP